MQHLKLNGVRAYTTLGMGELIPIYVSEDGEFYSTHKVLTGLGYRTDLYLSFFNVVGIPIWEKEKLKKEIRLGLAQQMLLNWPELFKNKNN
jgi:hypothetical protein